MQPRKVSPPVTACKCVFSGSTDIFDRIRPPAHPCARVHALAPFCSSSHLSTSRVPSHSPGHVGRCWTIGGSDAISWCCGGAGFHTPFWMLF
jgi:hypothetical protein